MNFFGVENYTEISKSCFHFLLTLILLLIAGCAADYQPFDSDVNVGYVDFPLNEEGKYYVSYSASGYTTVDETHDLALRRVKKLGNREGYKFYRIVEVNKAASDDRASVGPHGETELLKPLVTMVVKYYSRRPDDGRNVRSLSEKR